MTIKAVELINFQGHVHSLLEFHEGVNIIKGPSESGKSSVLRGLKWIIDNTPPSGKFKNHRADDKATVVATIEFTDGKFVMREQGKKENSYTTEEDVYEAMRRAVPDEVQTVLQMDSRNVKMQHDGYFLIQDTAGNVMKKLNEVTDLGEITDVIEKANKEVNRLRAEQKVQEAQKIDLESSLEKYVQLPEIRTLFDKLKALHGKREKVTGEIEAVTQLIEGIESGHKDLAEFEFLKGLEEEWAELTRNTHSWMKVEEEKDGLARLLNVMVESRFDLKTINEWFEIIPKYNLLREFAQLYTETQENAFQIKNLLQSTQSTRNAIVEATERVKLKEKEYETFLLEQKICPLCNQTLKGGIKI